MSLKVLVIPEDFRNDQYVLGPIMGKMLTEVGKPRARIEICKDPLLGGVSEALDWVRIEEIIEMYPIVDVFLLIVDRDGNANRRKVLTKIENKAKKLLKTGRALFGENAWQEIEVWALAGQGNLPKEWEWKQIRAEMHPKEKYFEPLARRRGLLDEPGAGRTTLGREAAQNYQRVRSRCKHDIQALETRLKDWFGEG